MWINKRTKGDVIAVFNCAKSKRKLFISISPINRTRWCCFLYSSTLLISIKLFGKINRPLYLIMFIMYFELGLYKIVRFNSKQDSILFSMYDSQNCNPYILSYGCFKLDNFSDYWYMQYVMVFF